jgi:phosphate transport system permease protein
MAPDFGFIKAYPMSLKASRFKYLGQSLIEGFIKLNALVAIVGIFLIFLFVFRESLPIFFDPEIQQEANIAGFFSGRDWQPVSDNPRYSFWPIILGSFKVTLIALLFAVPVAVAAALYSSEFAPRRLKEGIKPMVEILAGIPSVVLGFFALVFLASFLQGIFGWHIRLNAVNAGLALGVAVIPAVYSLAEDAISAVPGSFREAALGLGATPWQTAVKVVLPAAMPGVSAAVLFGMGRAIGETMVVLMAAGNAPQFTFDLLQSTRTLTATVAAELGEVVFGSAHYHTLFFIGLLLFGITYVINLASYYLFQGLMARMYGKKN